MTRKYLNKAFPTVYFSQANGKFCFFNFEMDDFQIVADLGSAQEQRISVFDFMRG